MAFGSIPKEFVSDTQIFDFKDNVSEALPKVEKFGAVVVTRNGQCYGIVDDRAVASFGNTRISKDVAVGKFARRSATLSKDSEIKNAIEIFYSSGLKALPYVENGKAKGIVKRSAILKAIISMHLFSTVKVDDMMSTPVIAIDAETSFEKAKAAMMEHKVNRLVVIDKGKLYGILTSKNIMQYGMKENKRMPEFSGGGDRHTHAGEICEKNPYTIERGSGAEDAIRTFVEKDISSLPVIKSGRPLGILTVRDVFETVVKNANVQKRNIVISGLDPDTKEYEPEIIAELESLADKVDRFKGNRVDYISLNIKRIKSKEYEMRSRFALSRGGAISIYAHRYSLEATLKDIIDKTYIEAHDKNDIKITGRKV
ncbi:MAG: CBS domain-containing protein [Candidatus Micrarchaeaceae archaeon]